MIFSGSVYPNVGTKYYAPEGLNPPAQSSLNPSDIAQLIVTRGGTVDQLYVEIENAPSTTAFVLTVIVNGSASSITVTIPIGNNSGSDLVDTDVFAPGQTLCIEIADTDGAGRTRWSFRDTPF